MDYYRNSRYRKNNKRTGYDRKHPYQSEYTKYRTEINDRCFRGFNSASDCNDSRVNDIHYGPPEKSFDDRGKQIFGYQTPECNSKRLNIKLGLLNNDEDLNAPVTNSVENRAKHLLNTVLTQSGVRSKLIFLETIDNALQTLQNTVDCCQVQMLIESGNEGSFILKMDQEEIVRGEFSNKQTAKNCLAEQAIEILRKDCFYIINKKVYEEISTKSGQTLDDPQPQTSFQGSKAHQMMLKMGWSGKGLGINEQGTEKTLAETIDQNITRQGLGNIDVFKKINKILEDYANSQKITLLRFNPDFTSEERAHIHKIAAKFGLKSKSEGKGAQRRITITKKLHRADLVFNLLLCDLENSLYKLVIPSNFAHLWNVPFSSI